ncbi:MAG: Rid family detoxifying hydrolase [Candidatus Methanomethyliaceae archaeon]|nr:Rid family detoxifying hydrolase [Candidatus Methanomethyliaceae archaeon]MDW7970517.1 Rid family detoxifying hydrolase [Nitrososphaerota archaeon]
MNYVYTDKAPKPIGPYSQAVIIDKLIFVSGQIPIDPNTNSIIRGSFKDSVKQVLNNVIEIIRAAGGDINTIFKMTIYLKDMNKFNEFNEIYGEYLKNHKPARAIIGVSSLPRDADLMIEAIALKKD